MTETGFLMRRMPRRVPPEARRSRAVSAAGPTPLAGSIPSRSQGRNRSRNRAAAGMGFEPTGNIGSSEVTIKVPDVLTRLPSVMRSPSSRSASMSLVPV